MSAFFSFYFHTVFSGIGAVKMLLTLKLYFLKSSLFIETNIMHIDLKIGAIVDFFWEGLFRWILIPRTLGLIGKLLRSEESCTCWRSRRYQWASVNALKGVKRNSRFRNRLKVHGIITGVCMKGQVQIKKSIWRLLNVRRNGQSQALPDRSHCLNIKNELLKDLYMPFILLKVDSLDLVPAK